MNISKALQRVRFEKGMNQIDVAKKAKISQTYLSQLETNSKKEPSGEVMKRLAKVYNIPPAVFAWYAMEESDVQPKKKVAYAKLKPVIDELISEFLK